MSNETFDFNSFVKESKDALLNPKSYFAALNLQGGFTEPLIKAVIYGAIAGIFSFLWSILNLTPNTGGLIGGNVGIMAFIWAVIGAVIALFIGAVIILILSSICKGNTDFEACLRVSAVMLVIMPILAFMKFVIGISIILGMFISFIITLYGLWILYVSLLMTLKTKPNSTRKVLYLILGIIAIWFIFTTNRLNKENTYYQDFNPQSEELFNN